MKSVLKKILPSTWVGALANTVNKLNRLIIAPFFFKEYPPEKIKYLRNISKRPIEDILDEPDKSYDNLPPVIKDSFTDFNSVKQNEFIASVDRCLIELKYGWPMTRSRELIYDCFPHSRQNIIPLPPLSALKQKCKEFDKIISFREIFEFGYWHFHTDIIHKNYLLEDFHEVDKNVPILISKELSTKSNFKFFYKNTDIFRGRSIVVQDDFIVSANTAYFIKPMPHTPEYYKRTSKKMTPWKGDSTANRKVFLTRAQSRGRFIVNMKAITDILKKYGFEFVDADTLGIEQQIRLFSETEVLVGIHGAGLTNMMFRFPHPMSVLEIFPFAEGRFQIPPHYFLLAGIFRFSYKALLGSPYVNKLQKTFYVDPSLLDSALKSLVTK